MASATAALSSVGSAAELVRTSGWSPPKSMPAPAPAVAMIAAASTEHVELRPLRRSGGGLARSGAVVSATVSYTHLTLPTKA